MGITRTDLFSADQNQLALLAKALGHPARIAILQHMLKTENCINGDLVKELGLAQATISQHLKELKSTGIIKGTIEGTSICYCIDPKKWNIIKDLFNQLFDQHPSCSEDDCC
ncbi:MAG: winged helix-turn-helix transcriptional regulator [Crocinitomicaceae bacterium]|nr:winged helix-turn-helix transcriptional regulator [Crocinitomicaceae bacterium]